ncbi:MAG: hypothetical protein LBH01_10005 [Verrucomicrobiales bacterium]|jgi:uncharacterized membrane protein YcgQ (UPF0703/DUF1980 family)|nr:hypothetical protein [Verrucomicrobiales bacterium]
MNLSRINSRFFSRASLLFPALLLGLWGCVIFRLKTSGLLAELQSPTYHPFSIGTAAACLVLALCYPLVSDIKRQSGRSRWPRLILAILLLASPVIIFATLPQDSPTTGFLARRYSSTSSNMNIYQLLGIDQKDLLQDLQFRKQHAANGQSLELDMLELNFIANNSGLRKLYDQTPVNLSGQWLADANGNTQSFRLVQMIMFCCAADAKVLGVRVDGQPPGGQNGAWIDVFAVLRFNSSGTPYLILQQSKPQDDAPPPDLPLPQR